MAHSVCCKGSVWNNQHSVVYDLLAHSKLINRTLQNELDGQGKARREAARRRNSERKMNFNSRNSCRSNGSRPTAVQRAVIGLQRGALVANRQRRRVRRRLNMSVINTGGGAHWTGWRRGAPHTSCYLWIGPYVKTAKFWREKWDFFQSRM